MLRTSLPDAHTNPGGNAGLVGAFRDGVLSNVLNPKVALFFLALMPQFIAPDSETKVAAFVVLGLTFVTTGTIWCLVLAFGAGRLRGYFTRHPRGWQAVSRASGGLFVLLGLRLALARQ
jgi:threonine/homoserine/homoserine lactone efflux protein